MKLWILRPVNEDAAPWQAWFDCMFGFVVRAESESAARKLAAEHAADEGLEAWISPETALCAELGADGIPGVIMLDGNPSKMGRAEPPRNKTSLSGPHAIPHFAKRQK
jgi:hypothetical protein